MKIRMEVTMTTGIAMAIELTNPGIKERIPTFLSATLNVLVLNIFARVQLQVRSKVACRYDRNMV